MKLTSNQINILERLTRAPIDKYAEVWNATHNKELSTLFEEDYISEGWNRLIDRTEWHITDAGRDAYDKYLLEHSKNKGVNNMKYVVAQIGQFNDNIDDHDANDVFDDLSNAEDHADTCSYDDSVWAVAEYKGDEFHQLISVVFAQEVFSR